MERSEPKSWSRETLTAGLVASSEQPGNFKGSIVALDSHLSPKLPLPSLVTEAGNPPNL